MSWATEIFSVLPNFVRVIHRINGEEQKEESNKNEEEFEEVERVRHKGKMPITSFPHVV